MLKGTPYVALIPRNMGEISSKSFFNQEFKNKLKRGKMFFYGYIFLKITILIRYVLSIKRIILEI